MQVYSVINENFSKESMKTTLKKCYLIAIVVLLPQFIFADEKQEMLAKFVITDATQNGQDLTPAYLEDGAYIVFYTSGDDKSLYMANFWPKSKTQSYGAVYSMESKNFEETEKQYKADIFIFNWRYINTYDQKKGTAKVEVTKIYKPQGVAFIIKIIPENLDILIYKGYMEGSVDFKSYD